MGKLKPTKAHKARAKTLANQLDEFILETKDRLNQFEYDRLNSAQAQLHEIADRK